MIYELKFSDYSAAGWGAMDRGKRRKKAIGMEFKKLSPEFTQARSLRLVHGDDLKAVSEIHKT